MELEVILRSRHLILALHCKRSLTFTWWTWDKDKWSKDLSIIKRDLFFCIFCTITLWGPAQEREWSSVPVSCVHFSYPDIPHSIKALACFFFVKAQRGATKWHGLRRLKNYCLPHFCKWIGLFSLCGLASVTAPCECSNLLSEQLHCWHLSAPASLMISRHLVWIPLFIWWFVVWPGVAGSCKQLNKSWIHLEGRPIRSLGWTKAQHVVDKQPRFFVFPNR